MPAIVSGRAGHRYLLFCSCQAGILMHLSSHSFVITFLTSRIKRPILKRYQNLACGRDFLPRAANLRRFPSSGVNESMVAFPVKKRIGLALSGGATRGLAHIGVLKALEDHHIRPDCLSGSSIGAVAASLYAFGVPVKEMRWVGQGMTLLDVSKLELSRDALFSNEELGKLILAEIGKARIEDAKIPLAMP